MDLILNPTSRAALMAYSRRPGHSLLLHGLEGVGLRTISKSIAKQLAANISLVELQPDDKGKISIDTIHELTPKLRSVRREQPLVVVIDDADKMTRQAQDAFLKSLEEPVNGVYFILTSHQPDNLLATVTSRLAKLEIRQVTSDDSLELLKSLGDFDKHLTAQLMFIANGRPAELKRLTGDEAYLETQSKLVVDAKALIGASPYERLKIVNHYDKNRDQAIKLLATLLDVIKFMTLEHRDPSLIGLIAPLEQTISNLNRNGHTRTQLASLVAQWR